MTTRILHSAVLAVTSVSSLAPSALATDWSNSGGDPARTGYVNIAGPDQPHELWNGALASFDGRTCLVAGDRMYSVRPTGTAVSALQPIVCRNIDTGAVLWTYEVPYVASAGDTFTRLLGVGGGRVLATRGSNIHCLTATTGAVQWALLFPGGTDVDDVVWASNGDFFLGAVDNVCRVIGGTGFVPWISWRNTVGTGAASPAHFNDALYTVAAVAGGARIQKYDAVNGALLGESPTITVTNINNSPFVGSDGSVYWLASRTVGPGTLYAFTDLGSAFVTRWTKPTSRAAYARSAIGPDGAIYHVNTVARIEKLAAATGAVLATSAAAVMLDSIPQYRFAIDADDHVYFGNGGLALGALTCFTTTLVQRWSIAAPNLGLGGPALGTNGTLLLAGGTPDVRAYRAPRIRAFCFGDGSGVACPCGGVGASDAGCPSSVNPAGGRLTGSGIAVISDDTFLLQGSQLTNGPGLYFQGTAQQNGGAGVQFGDGLRCVGGTIVRLATKQTAAGTSQYPEAGDAPISIRGLIPATGGARHYQIWYRNAAAFCTSATFNLTNGVSVTWLP